MKNKVFLGGTCADTTWRKDIEMDLCCDFFNPVVKDWTEECRLREDIEKQVKCNVHLYVITSAMQGVYSIAEAVQSSHQKDKLTVFIVMPKGFHEGELMSLHATANLLKGNGAITAVCNTTDAILDILNMINN